MTRQLLDQFQPRRVSITLSGDESVIAQCEEELRGFAATDANKCFGYFPALKDSNDIKTDLPKCALFAQHNPTLTVENKKLSFNFVRLSLIEQKGHSPFHLDSDAKTAITGDVASIESRIVWRLLINLSTSNPRTLSYLNLDPFSIKLDRQAGYIHADMDSVQARDIETVSIPPRNGLEVHGVLFCASRILHTGRDDKHGHFVAGFGAELCEAN